MSNLFGDTISRTIKHRLSCLSVLTACLILPVVAVPSMVASADESSNGHNVGGAILQEWIAVGRNGFAITDESNANYGGKWQAFSNHNSIYYHRDTGAHQVGGLIRDRWEQLGWENSALHFPTTRELAARKPGRFNRFQGGNIYWKSGASAAYNVQGEILAKWGQLDYENGKLGFPTSNEVKLNKYGGAVSSFEGGAIYWSPNTGAHVVWGSILDNWASRNFENGRFGYPVSDEYDFNGGKAQNFEASTMDWLPGDPARPADVIEPVGTQYADYGYVPPVVAREAAPEGESAETAPTPDAGTQPEVGTAPPIPSATGESSANEETPSLSTEPESTVSSSPSSTTTSPSDAPGTSSDGFNGIVGPLRQQNPTDPDDPDLGACGVQIDNAHASNGYANQIHTRVRSYCPAPGITDHMITGKTKRLRWWGAGFLPALPEAGSPASFGPSLKQRIITTTAVNCSRGSIYDYKVYASGSAKVGSKSYSQTINFTFTKIKCENIRWN